MRPVAMGSFVGHLIYGVIVGDDFAMLTDGLLGQLDMPEGGGQNPTTVHLEMGNGQDRAPRFHGARIF
jgi:hypothetical protein